MKITRKIEIVNFSIRNIGTCTVADRLIEPSLFNIDEVMFRLKATTKRNV